MTSDPGSYLVQHCHVADVGQRGLFNLHDEYVGSFHVPGSGGGGLTLRVTRANSSTGFVEMIATFRHGACVHEHMFKRSGVYALFVRGTCVHEHQRFLRHGKCMSIDKNHTKLYRQ